MTINPEVKSTIRTVQIIPSFLCFHPPKNMVLVDTAPALV